MRRSPRVLLTWLAALAVALTTARVVGGDLAALHRRASSLGPLRPVIVATHDLALGQRVATGDVRRETRYTQEVPGAVIADAGSAVGRIVVVPVLRDAFIFSRHLAPAARTGLGAVIPRGDRAVHVVAKDGYQPPRGAVVDVLATFDPTAVPVAGTGNFAVVVASGARILAVDDTASRESASSNAGVTMLVTEAEARAIAFAASAGDLALAVAPPETACCDEPGR